MAKFLLLNPGAGMWRVVREPTAIDRMLTAVTAVVFVQRTWPNQEAGTNSE